ncbi:MAG: hypothetical protein ABIL09_02235 [Gemmatimonadota bacterium]
MRAQGDGCYPGCNLPLHLHPLRNTCDVYGHDKPTRIAHANRDLRQPAGSLPVGEGGSPGGRPTPLGEVSGAIVAPSGPEGEG